MELPKIGQVGAITTRRAILAILCAKFLGFEARFALFKRIQSKHIQTRTKSWNTQQIM